MQGKVRGFRERIDYDNLIILSGIISWGAFQLAGWSLVETTLSAIFVMVIVLGVRIFQKLD